MASRLVMKSHARINQQGLGHSQLKPWGILQIPQRPWKRVLFARGWRWVALTGSYSAVLKRVIRSLANVHVDASKCLVLNDQWHFNEFIRLIGWHCTSCLCCWGIFILSAEELIRSSQTLVTKKPFEPPSYPQPAMYKMKFKVPSLELFGADAGGLKMIFRFGLNIHQPLLSIPWARREINSQDMPRRCALNCLTMFNYVYVR